MTAEEFILERWSGIPSDPDEVLELMRGFAKMHVNAALKAASNSVHHPYLGTFDNETLQESTLEAYPLSNIK